MGRCAVTLAVAGLLIAAGARTASGDGRCLVGDQVFENREAAQLVLEGRQCDPGSCPEENRDRDKAALLYERAIAAQPGAAINALLAQRIAELYSYYEDRQKRTYPNLQTAQSWWQHSIALAKPTEFVWVQDQMGLGCVCLLQEDLKGALSSFLKILDFSPDAAELPDWQLRPAADTEAGKAQLEADRQRMRNSIAALQEQAVTMAYDTARKIEGAFAAAILKDIEARHYGTPVGKRASDILARKLRISPSDLEPLSDAVLNKTSGTANVAAEGPSADKLSTAPSDGDSVLTSSPHTRSLASEQDWGTRFLYGALIASVAIGLAVSLVVTVRRRTRREDEREEERRNHI